jgi:hypothetical protein
MIRSHRRFAAVLAAACVTLVRPLPATAAEVRIDFEHYPGLDGVLGTPDDVPVPTCWTAPPCPEGPVANLTTQYSSVGVTFSQGTLLYGPTFWPGHGHYISSSPPDATFSVPVHFISIHSYSYWKATLTAYDAAGEVVATAVLPQPPPGRKVLGTLSVTSPQPIARFTVLPEDPDYILNLDHLRFGASASYYTLAPCRVVDTRHEEGVVGGPALGAGAERVFPLANRCGIPPTAVALSVNLTVTQPTATGHLKVYPAGTLVPTTSALNYGAGQTRANNAVVELNAAGELAVRCVQGAGTAHVIVDVTGYFQ